MKEVEVLKFNVLVLNKKNIFTIFIFLFTSIVLIFSIVRKVNIQNTEKQIIESKQSSSIKKTKNYISVSQAIENFDKKINLDTVEVGEYAVIPQYIQGFLVVGELQIPSIELDTYILNETSDKSLNVSVTKLAGPKINEIGNFCITGHNYLKNNMFSKLKKVNIDDKIILIDTFGKQKEYVVYDKLEVSPEDTSVLSQNTNNKTEVTLITCTVGARKRIVVKASST